MQWLGTSRCRRRRPAQPPHGTSTGRCDPRRADPALQAVTHRVAASARRNSMGAPRHDGAANSVANTAAKPLRRNIFSWCIFSSIIYLMRNMDAGSGMVVRAAFGWKMRVSARDAIPLRKPKPRPLCIRARHSTALLRCSCITSPPIQPASIAARRWRSTARNQAPARSGTTRLLRAGAWAEIDASHSAFQYTTTLPAHLPRCRPGRW